MCPRRWHGFVASDSVGADVVVAVAVGVRVLLWVVVPLLLAVVQLALCLMRMQRPTRAMCWLALPASVVLRYGLVHKIARTGYSDAVHCGRANA